MLTEEQLEARKGLITSSNVAACLNLDPYTTPIAAALRARGEMESVDNKAIERGNLLEDIVLGYVADEQGWAWNRAPFRRHPEYPWAADSADACYRNHDGDLVAIGEAKTAALGSSREFGEPGTDEVPTACLLQAQWHLAHWPEVRTCWVPVLVGGYQFEFRTYRVKADVGLQRALFEDLFEFWTKYVHGNDLPLAQAGDTDFIKHRLQQSTTRYAADTKEIRDACQEAWAATERRKAASDTEKTFKNRLRLLLNDAEGVRASWGNVHYRTSKGRTKTDWEAIARELAGGDVDENVIQRYTSIGPGIRSLRINPKKGIWDDRIAAI